MPLLAISQRGFRAHRPRRLLCDARTPSPRRPREGARPGALARRRAPAQPVDCLQHRRRPAPLRPAPATRPSPSAAGAPPACPARATARAQACGARAEGHGAPQAGCWEASRRRATRAEGPPGAIPVEGAAAAPRARTGGRRPSAHAHAAAVAQVNPPPQPGNHANARTLV